MKQLQLEFFSLFRGSSEKSNDCPPSPAQTKEAFIFKRCSACLKEKNLKCFCKHKKGKYGRNQVCRECKSKAAKAHYRENAEETKKKISEYRGKNKKKIILQGVKYRRKNADAIKRRSSEYYNKNKKRHYEQGKQWKKNNREKYLKKNRESSRKRRNTNLEQYRLRARMRDKERRKNNLQYAMTCRLRSRMHSAIKAAGTTKADKTLELLGCTARQLVGHIESLFIDGMTWENRALWHIDHIKPCASFDLKEKDQQQKCFHYTNLRPLWALDNCRKGDRI